LPPEESTDPHKVHGASNLIKRDLLSFPDPVAVISIDGEQTATTATVRKTLSPSWNESFAMYGSSFFALILMITHVHHFQLRETFICDCHSNTGLQKVQET